MSPRVGSNDNKFIKIVPGPGAYSPTQRHRQNFSFSFGLKPSVDYQSKYLSTLPGPGQYEGRGKKTFSTVGASLDQSKRQELASKTLAFVPGPGRYEPVTPADIIKND